MALLVTSSIVFVSSGCFGKWHLGMNWGVPPDDRKIAAGTPLTDGPTTRGFDVFCGYTEARSSLYSAPLYQPQTRKNCAAGVLVKRTSDCAFRQKGFCYLRTLPPRIWSPDVALIEPDSNRK